MTGYTPGAEEVGPSLAGTFKDMPDINVVRHGGKLLALGESATPFRLTPELATCGRETFDGTIPAGITAHPKVDPRTGEMAVFCYGLEPPYLTWSLLGPDGSTRRTPTAVPDVDEPVMVHDMALTERFLVLVLAPLYFDIAAAMRGGSMLAWCPDDGTRVALIPRDGGPVRWATSEAYWSWHNANACSSWTRRRWSSRASTTGGSVGATASSPSGRRRVPSASCPATTTPCCGSTRRPGAPCGGTPRSSRSASRASSRARATTTARTAGG